MTSRRARTSNTSIALIMELVNELYAQEPLEQRTCSGYILKGYSRDYGR